MARPRFSVIIPTYNGEQYICDAVDSVCAQTFTDFELIVVDDGCTDTTLERLEPYGSQITLLSRPNGGTPAGARNFGLASASGEFIAFLDHDDLWRVDKLASIALAIDTHPGCRFIFSDFSRTESTSSRCYGLSNSQIFSIIYDALRSQMYEGLKSFELDRDTMFELLLKSYPIYPSTMVINKELLEETGPWNEDRAIKGNEDFDMSLRCSLKTSFCYIDERLVTVRRHGNNLSSDSILQREGDLRVLDTFLARAQLPEEKRELTHFHKGRRLTGIAYAYLRRNEKQTARRYYLQALAFPGLRVHALSRFLASFIR